jgi:hypothetical protein
MSGQPLVARISELLPAAPLSRPEIALESLL